MDHDGWRMPPRWLRRSACWLASAAIAWPVLALAPAPAHTTLWSATFEHASEVGTTRGQAAFAVPRSVVDWIILTHDNRGLPFIVLDKAAAHLYVFDIKGTLLGATPVLLGAARGDDSFPGIGQKPLSAVRPEEKTTPAGRFVAERGRNLNGEDIFWVDYDAAVSMHRVRPTNPRERRLERLATPTTLDNRISFGCINVPARFYEDVVQRTLSGGRGVVYVLPETRPAFTVFGIGESRSYTVAAAQ